MPGERKVGDFREKSAPEDAEVPSGGGDRTATSKREPVSKEADAIMGGGSALLPLLLCACAAALMPCAAAGSTMASSGTSHVVLPVAGFQ